MCMSSHLHTKLTSKHFHLPPQWLNGSLINDDTYANLLEIAANEVDWPMVLPSLKTLLIVLTQPR